MKRSILFFMAASILAAVSCTKEANNEVAPIKEKVAMSFDATIGIPTKVELGDATANGYKVNWSVGDAITVVAHDNTKTTGYVNGDQFTTDLIEASTTATFIGESEAGDAYYALYPYNSSHRWYYDNSRFSAVFNAAQTANGLKNGLLTAKVVDGSLQFKHVTGYIKFEIPSTLTNIAQVTFSGKGDETIGGKYVYVSPDQAVMHSVTESNAVNKLTLLPDGDVFAPGVYYIAALPAELESGIVMTFTDADGSVATKESANPAEIKAGDILNLGEISGLNFEVSTGTTYIFDFTDPSSLNITPPSNNSSGTDLSSDESYGTGEIIMTVTNASNATRIWKTTSGAYELRTYKNGGSLTFTAPSGMNITKVTFVGAKVAVFTVTTGTFSSGEWTGSSNSVKFTATNTANIQSATIIYE